MKYVFKNQKVYILFKLSQTGSLTHYLCQTGTILSCLLKENDNTFKVEMNEKKEKKTGFCLTCSYFRILHAFGANFLNLKKLLICKVLFFNICL